MKKESSGAAGLGEAQRTLFSLNNGNAVKPSDKYEEENLGGVPTGGGVIGSVPVYFRDYEKRDYLDSLLVGLLGDKLSISEEDFLNVYEKHALSIFNIKDNQIRISEKQASYREHNFHLCHHKERDGSVFVNQTGEQAYYQVFNCSEQGCLRCDYNQRQNKVSLKWIDAIEGISLFHKSDFPGVVGIIWTLPSSVESIPLYDDNVRKRLHDGIHDIIREMFWCVKGFCGEPDSRAGVGNVGLHLFDHVVGDSDLFRDRFHIHSLITPAVISEKEGLTFLQPAPYVRKKAANGLHPDPFVIDFSWLRVKWKKLIETVFEQEFEHVSNPDYTFIKNSNNHDDFMRQLHHRFKYDSRHFSKDFMRSVVRTDVDNDIFIVKCKNPDNFYWRKVDALDFVERYSFVRSHTKVDTRGFWCRFETYSEKLCGVRLKQKVFNKETINNLVGPVQLKLFDSIEKHYCKKRKRVVIEKKLIFNFLNPVTNQIENRTSDQMRRLLI